MTTVIDKVTKAIDPEDFYSEYFDGRLDGRSNLPCPFPSKHKKGEDKLPSFRVFLDSGGTYCHGCGFKSSSPVGFYAAMKDVSMEKAARILYSRYVDRVIPTDAYKSPAEKLMGNELVLKKLLEARGITKDTARKYRLGYDGKRLTIPIFNEDGFCMNIRRYDLYKSGGPKMVSYAEGRGKARLFPQESLLASTVFVVEGELDAILGCQAGLSCISPSGGATAWNDDWGRLFKGKTVFVIPDNDDPGRRGAELRRRSIAKHAESCQVVALPVRREGEDLTDWILHYDGSAQALRQLCKVTKEEAPAPKKKVFDLLEGIEDGARNKSELALLSRAEVIWEDLVAHGAFFKNAGGQLYYAGENMEAMHVTNVFGPFMSFLSNRTPLINQALTSGKFIFHHIMHKANNMSELSKTGTWTMYDTGKLYIHAGKDKILKLGDGKPTYIKNAINEDRVLLDLPVRSMMVADLPAQSPVEGLKSFKNLFMNNLAMQEEDRYLVACWLSSIFFRDYVKPKPIVRFLAKTASGKSTSSKLVSVMLYGEELLSHSASTVAATYEMSSKYPLLILDNLESRNMNQQLEDFLLVAATGGMKAKRMMSTDTGLILQHTNSLVLTNGIEPFNRHELIDRTLEMNLDLEKYGNDSFQEARVFGQLRAERAKIMSALLFLVNRYVIPRIKKGEISRIMKEFGQHGKERFNEYLAVMCITLDALWGYMPLEAYRRPHDLVNFWLDSQTRLEQRQDEGTNEVLYFISTFMERYEQLMGSGLGSMIRLEKSDEGAVMKCTTRELFTDFRLLAKTLGIKCPWVSERHLGTRIADSEEIMNRSGWYRRQYVSAGRTHYEFKFLHKKVKGED